ncbi:hypothetical protein EDB89DRAFT_1978467 [Lactarius sanguifluus]|nr:hypothetical protein EDB89DRAFT_1978467 [Lactarius sanguifluus]
MLMGINTSSPSACNTTIVTSTFHTYRDIIRSPIKPMAGRFARNKNACDRTVAYRHTAALGVLGLGRPFDASSKLHGGDCLTLIDIVHSRLRTAELSSLSSRHTAQTTYGSIADEALYLTAAVRCFRFRSVIPPHG